MRKYTLVKGSTAMFRHLLPPCNVLLRYNLANDHKLTVDTCTLNEVGSVCFVPGLVKS